MQINILISSDKQNLILFFDNYTFKFIFLKLVIHLVPNIFCGHFFFIYFQSGKVIFVYKPMTFHYCFFLPELKKAIVPDS